MVEQGYGEAGAERVPERDRAAEGIGQFIGCAGPQQPGTYDARERLVDNGAFFLILSCPKWGEARPFLENQRMDAAGLVNSSRPDLNPRNQTVETGYSGRDVS